MVAVARNGYNIQSLNMAVCIQVSGYFLCSLCLAKFFLL